MPHLILNKKDSRAEKLKGNLLDFIIIKDLNNKHIGEAKLYPLKKIYDYKLHI